MVLSVKGLTADQISDELLETLADEMERASFLWSVVEKTPVSELWGFSEAQRAEIAARIVRARAALDAFGAAVAAGDRAALSALGVAMKQAFVPAYVAFSSDPTLSKLPAY